MKKETNTRREFIAKSAVASAGLILGTNTFCSLKTPAVLGQNDKNSINGVLRVHPENPRYFTDNSGKVIYLTGSHTWNTLQDGTFFTTGDTDPPPVFDFTKYLEFLKLQNHNFIRLWRFESPKFYYWNQVDGEMNRTMGYKFTQPHPWLRTGPGLAFDEKPKFDLTKFDEEFFIRLRTRIIEAGKRGIYVSVMLFEGGELRDGKIDAEKINWGWRSHPFKLQNNINGIEADLNNDGRGFEFHSLLNHKITELQKAYIQKIVNTVNDLDNVIYEVGNELIYSTENTDWQYWVINYIKEYEASMPKQHPVGMTCQMHYPWMRFLPDESRNDVLFNSPADWISPGGFGGRGYLNDESIPIADGTKVLLFDQDHVWGIGGDKAWVWKSFTRGHNVINMDPLPEITEQISTFSKSPEIRAAMGHTLSYANKMNLAAMTPDSSYASCSTTYCLMDPGKEYLIYQPVLSEYQPVWENNFFVNLFEGEYKFEWFNPTTGQITDKGSVKVSEVAKRSFKPPFSGDAVLYIKNIKNN